MVDWGAFIQGAEGLLRWDILLLMIGGVFFGTLCGAIPGFNSSMAVVVCLPMTYSMDPLLGLVFLCSIYVSAIYGGSITAILINTPGTASSAATAFDGYPLTLQGKANHALGIALGGSAIGGTISYFLMLFVMYPIAAFAVKFGPTEMFMLAVFGLSIIGSISDGSFSKAMVAGIFGLMLAAVGTSSTGALRMTFGSNWLMDGLPMIPVIIGLFAFSEMFSMLTKEFIAGDAPETSRSFGEIAKWTLWPYKSPVNLIRSSLIGTFIGAVPAAGGTIASFISYNQAKQVSKVPETFGKGNYDGILASESSNNASTGGALMTMFALGIPGSATTAIMLGALQLHGLNPGPQLFMNQMPLVYAIVIALFASQVIMWVIGMIFSYSLSGLLAVSTKILVPLISVLCVVGAFAIRKSLFDCFLMVGFGILGYLMKQYKYPIIAVVLGVVLGPIADSQFIRTTIRFRGDYTVFLTRPISLGLVIITLFVIALPFILKKVRTKKTAQQSV